MVRSRPGFTIAEVMIVIAIAGIVIVLALLSVPALQKSRRNGQARKELNQIIAAVEVAQDFYRKPLRQITGNGCSDCSCRPPALLTSATCVSNWTSAATKISVAGLDISDLASDPWGNPYLLDENEGESGPTDCRQDTIRTAGNDGTLSTSDDISFRILLKVSSCPPTI